MKRPDFAERVNMRSASIGLKEAADQVLSVSYVEHCGNVSYIRACGEDGKPLYYATNSPTVLETIMAIEEEYADTDCELDLDIAVRSAKSNAGREFLYLTIV